MNLLQDNKYSFLDIEYLKQALSPSIEDGFYDFLRDLTAKDVILNAVDEGKVVFPR